MSVQPEIWMEATNRHFHEAISCSMSNLTAMRSQEWAQSIENQMTKFMDYLRDLGVRGNEGETIGDLWATHQESSFQ